MHRGHVSFPLRRTPPHFTLRADFLRQPCNVTQSLRHQIDEQIISRKSKRPTYVLDQSAVLDRRHLRAQSRCCPITSSNIASAANTRHAITHPEYFYGFIGVGLAWQVAFLIIATDPRRYRPLIIPSIIEKFSFAAAIAVLFARVEYR